MTGASRYLNNWRDAIAFLRANRDASLVRFSERGGGVVILNKHAGRPSYPSTSVLAAVNPRTTMALVHRQLVNVIDVDKTGKVCTYATGFELPSVDQEQRDRVLRQMATVETPAPANRSVFNVDAGAILKEIERDYTNNGDRTNAGIVMSCQIIRVELHAIGSRAVELGDAALLSSLLRLGVVKAEA